MAATATVATGGEDGAVTDSEPMSTTVATPLWGLWNTSRVHVIGTEMGFFNEEGLEASKPDTEGGEIERPPRYDR